MLERPTLSAKEFERFTPRPGTFAVRIDPWAKVSKSFLLPSRDRLNTEAQQSGWIASGPDKGKRVWWLFTRPFDEHDRPITITSQLRQPVAKWVEIEYFVVDGAPYAIVPFSHVLAVEDPHG